MLNIGIVGLGKMGISHFGIVNAHKKANLCAVCDATKLVTWGVQKYTGVKAYSDYFKMLKDENLEALIIATPTKFHAEHLRAAIDQGLHVFVEKPFCLDSGDSRAITEATEKKSLVTQVGYHNRFIGTFRKAQEYLQKGYIGKVHHIHGEAYGPVVTKKQKSSWRTKKSEGGGCLYDYASHVINLMGYLTGASAIVEDAVLQKIYSAEAEDAVFASLQYPNDMTGRLTVNWSDETYRKMVTGITLQGEAGKIIVNAQELRIYLKNEVEGSQLEQGWNVSYLTDHSLPVDFYLRGEEYSAQIDSFLEAVENRDRNNLNSFTSALETDVTISEIFQVAKRVG